MQTITNPELLSAPFADQGQKNTIPVEPTGTYLASQKEGFPPVTMLPVSSGGEPPSGKDMNGALNLTSQHHFFMQNGGWETFRQDVSDAIGGYPQGAILWYRQTGTNRVIPVLSLVPNNTYNFNTTPNYIDGTHWIETFPTGGARNVADIFWTMRSESGLNGAVEANGNTYSTDDFLGADSIGNLLAAGKVPFVSLATYATLLSTNGSVGVFGWDGVGTTAFRVPSLNDIFIETGTAAQIGDYIAPGAPNILGAIDVIGEYKESTGNAEGALKPRATEANVQLSQSSGRSTRSQGIAIDASESSALFGESNTIQPNTVRYRAMVQLATGATDEALETCTQVLSDVADLQANKVAKGHEVIEFQAPTAQNNYTWYRKYADGWVEQGGRTTHANASGVTTTVNLPVEMLDTNYNVQIATGRTDGTADAAKGIGFSIIDEKSFVISMYTPTGWSSQSTTFSWEVKGMYPQP